MKTHKSSLSFKNNTFLLLNRKTEATFCSINSEVLMKGLQKNISDVLLRIRTTLNFQIEFLMRLPVKNTVKTALGWKNNIHEIDKNNFLNFFEAKNIHICIYMHRTHHRTFGKHTTLVGKANIFRKT